jgi:DNA-binding NtrC family response regulator
MLQQSDVNVLVLDVFVSGKDGLTTLREIKKLKPLTEVIMLTGHGSFDTAIQGIKLGAYDFLMKPTKTEDLVSKNKEGLR